MNQHKDTNINDILPLYDAFVFSAYGTLYEESDIHSDAQKLMEHLSKEGKLVYIFTNSPVRQTAMMHHLKQRGIPPSNYQHIITAAEEAFRHLQRRKDPWHASLGNKYYFIGRTEDTGILDELSYQRVSSIDKADFIFVLSTDEWHTAIDDYKPTLEQGLRLNLPLICANPDLFLYINDSIDLQAGSIAKCYELMGGEVYYHGKPYPSFFHRLKQELSPIPRERTLIIGDSLNPDVAGATKHGFDSLLIIRNTTLCELNLANHENNFSVEEISASIQTMGYNPKYIAKTLDPN